MENEQKLFLGGRKKRYILFQKNLFNIEILVLALSLLVYRSKHAKVADRRWENKQIYRKISQNPTNNNS